jgi:hypothetical protein
MAFSYRDVSLQRGNAAHKLLDVDRSIQAFGICRHGDGFGFRAVRKKQRSFLLSRRTAMDSFEGIPISYAEASDDVRFLAGPGGSGQGSQSRLYCGVEIQNVDSGPRGAGYVGTLGCFVNLTDGTTAMLTCNHVIAGELGKIGDRIVQPGSNQFSGQNEVAKLALFKRLQPSPPGANLSTAYLNRIDAAVARLNAGISFTQALLPRWQKPLVPRTGQPNDGDTVYKVGIATDYTEGRITGIDMLVPDLPYSNGGCWFDGSIEIEGLSGLFAKPGDSGAAVLNSSGEILGILYGTNLMQYWVSPIDLILNDLNCSVA